MQDKNANGDLVCLTLQEIAKVLNCNYQTVSQLVKRADLKAFKLGKAYRVMKNDLIEYLQELKDDNYLYQVKRQNAKKNEIVNGN